MSENSTLMATFTDALFSPSTAFALGSPKPKYRWWIPLLLLAASISLFWIVYYSTVDLSWITQQAITELGKDQSKQMLAVIEKFISRNTLIIMSSVSGVVGALVMVGLTAAYLNVISQFVCPGAVKFSAWLNLSAWSKFPEVLSYVCSTLAFCFEADHQVSGDQAIVTSISAYIASEPISHVARLLVHYNFINLWSLLILVLGSASVMHISKTKACVVVLCPWALYWAARITIASLL
jgi:hypothetical protein